MAARSRYPAGIAPKSLRVDAGHQVQIALAKADKPLVGVARVPIRAASIALIMLLAGSIHRVDRWLHVSPFCCGQLIKLSDEASSPVGSAPVCM